MEANTIADNARFWFYHFEFYCSVPEQPENMTLSRQQYQAYNVIYPTPPLRL